MLAYSDSIGIDRCAMPYKTPLLHKFDLSEVKISTPICLRFSWFYGDISLRPAVSSLS